jgi:hypothetical protein
MNRPKSPILRIKPDQGVQYWERSQTRESDTEKW